MDGVATIEPGTLRLPAKLFSCDGKLAVTLSALSPSEATLASEAAPAAGTIAVVVRNGVRICGTVATLDDAHFRLDFERAIDPREQEMFCGAAAQSTVTTTLPTC